MSRELASLAELAQFSTLLEKIYDAALSPGIWSEVAERVAAWVGANKTLIHTPLQPIETDGIQYSYGISTHLLGRWRTSPHIHGHGVGVVEETGKGVDGKVILGTEEMPTALSDGASSFQAIFGIHDPSQMISGIVFDGRTAALPATVCTSVRGNKQACFDKGDVARYQLLIPHLSRALGVMYRLRQSEQSASASLAALDKLAVGVLLIAPPMDIVFANRAARNILDAADGLYLEHRVHHMDRLVAADPAIQQRIDTALHHAVQGDILDIPHFCRSLTIRRPSERPPYTLQFSALPELNEFDQGISVPRAIIFLSDTSQSVSVAPERLVTLFGLSGAEARLAVALADGEELQSVAGRLGIGLNTAKTQLQSIYAKMNIDNRSKLVRLLFSLRSTLAG
jgi:DNA-binding CsgD family transcriptional regulator